MERQSQPIMLLTALLLVTSAAAQEVPDLGQEPLIARPAYPQDKGPVVAIDEAHKNTHTYSGRAQGFVQLLQSDGYRVRPLTEAISSKSLKGVDVLVVGNPGRWEGPEASLTDPEVAALLEWVRRGGSLLLLLDHTPGPRNSAKLANALGVPNWHDGYAMVEIPDSLPIGPIIFWRSGSLAAEEPTVTRLPDGTTPAYQGPDAVLVKHPITDGRSTDERVSRVTTFVGSAFQPPEGAVALMTMPRRAVSLTLKTQNVEELRTAPRASVGGWLQGAALKVGKGRVAIFGEIGLFSGGPAPDNRKFVLNVLHWLSGIL